MENTLKNEIVTTDLSDFGTRELVELEFLLKALREQGLPDDFNNDKVVAMMNKNSGNVFLTNSDYQVAMLTSEDTLEFFYSCPQCGHEGFLDEMDHNEDDKDCQEYLNDIKRDK
jgi:hypothetical protein